MQKNITILPYTGVAFSQVVKLYNKVGWDNYTQDPRCLQAALQNSLSVLAAYENNKLIGLLRAVGDGCTIVYIQDVLVLPTHQRRGIGKRLVTQFRRLYPAVHQTILLIDDSPENHSFYKSCGFESKAGKIVALL